MAWKNAGLVAIGVALGLSAITLVQRLTASTGSEMDGARSPIANESLDTLRASLAERDRRVAELSSELEAARAPLTKGVPHDNRVRLSISDPQKAIEQRLEVAHATLLKRETDQLLAAGFSMDRIEWIRRRSEELQVERRRADADRQRQGLPPDPEKLMAYFYDGDLDLRGDIGDYEYERYRQALGRPTGVGIRKVLEGSTAESAGLKPGDEIVGYGGKRVFNFGEVTALSSKGKPSEPVVLDVRRDGQTIQVVVPRGRLNIESPPQVPPIRSLLLESASARP